MSEILTLEQFITKEIERVARQNKIIGNHIDNLIARKETSENQTEKEQIQLAIDQHKGYLVFLASFDVEAAAQLAFELQQHKLGL